MLASTRLRELMLKKCVLLPGAFNGLAGRIAAETGFQGLYVSGAAVSAAQGIPDIGLVPLTEFCRVIKEVVTVTDLPVIADADTGFGEIESIKKTVHDYISAGAAGLHIEDQVFPKRCGHLDGKALVPSNIMVEKIKRAKKAVSESYNKDFIICARTDARGVEGMESALRRATEYVGAGADMIFPEGLAEEKEFDTFVKRMREVKNTNCGNYLKPEKGPFMLANMTEFGKTPIIKASVFEQLGYHCVIYPVSALRTAMKSVQELFQTIAHEGSVKSAISRMSTRKELYDTLRYIPGKEWSYPSISNCGGIKKN